MFSDVKKLFQIFQAKRQHRVTDGEADYLMHVIFTVFILLNCKTCFSGPRSGYFDLTPPTIEEYLPLNVEFPKASDVAVPDEYLCSPRQNQGYLSQSACCNTFGKGY